MTANHIPSSRVFACVLLVYSAIALGCKSNNGADKSFNAAKKGLVEILREAKYSHFSPLRTEAYPGTFFGITTDFVSGELIETELANYKEAFDVNMKAYFESHENNEDIQLLTNFRGKANSETKGSLDLLGGLLSVGTDASKFSDVEIALGPSQTRYSLSATKLREVGKSINEHLLAELQDWQLHGTLHAVGVITEVLEVDSVKITLTYNTRRSARLAASNLGGNLNGWKVIDGGEFGDELSGKYSVVISSKSPVMIGYRAVKCPTYLLDTHTSSGSSDLESITEMIISSKDS